MNEEEFSKKISKSKDISVRAANCLLLAGFETKGQVILAIESGELQCSDIPGMGYKSLKEIIEWSGCGEAKEPIIYSSEKSICNYINSVINTLNNKPNIKAVRNITVKINESGIVSSVTIDTEK